MSSTAVGSAWFCAFPDAHVDVHGIHIIGDVVVEEGTFTGAHNGILDGPMGPSCRPGAQLGSVTSRCSASVTPSMFHLTSCSTGSRCSSSSTSSPGRHPPTERSKLQIRVRFASLALGPLLTSTSTRSFRISGRAARMWSWAAGRTFRGPRLRGFRGRVAPRPAPPGGSPACRGHDPESLVDQGFARDGACDACRGVGLVAA
jgi:hypothetical protein